MAFISLADIIPAGRTPPAGERLTGTAAMLKLELLCEGKPAYFVGNEQRAEGVEPNWRMALDYARELSERSADLGIMVRLSAACLRWRTLQAFTDCIETTADLLEAHWPDCFPELEVDDDGAPPDASVRLGVLGRLEDEKLILGPLRDAVLVRDEQDRPQVTLAALASGPGIEGTEFITIIAQASADLARLNEAARRIERAVHRYSPQDSDFSVRRFLETGEQLLAGVARVSVGQAQEGQVAADHAKESAAALSAGSDPLRGREQAIQMLGQLIRYFEVAEPSSPVVGLLVRARELIGKDFWTLMQELGDQRLVDMVGESRLFGRRN